MINFSLNKDEIKIKKIINPLGQQPEGMKMKKTLKLLSELAKFCEMIMPHFGYGFWEVKLQDEGHIIITFRKKQ